MKNLGKISIAMLLIFGVTATSNAQINDTSKPQIGVKGGLNFSNLHDNDVDDDNMLTSFNAGLYTNFPITNILSIQPELLYSRKGSESVYDNAIATGTAKFKLNYLELPVLLKINVADNINIHAGPYFAYLLNAKVTNETDSGDFDFEENYDNDDFNKFDTGLSIGLGFDLDSVGFGLRYNYGLSTVGKERTFAGETYTIPDGKNSTINVYLAVPLN
ncbi:porin family protein [Tamlana sp. I1]|uniref:porin family protein n=1 Tax=Tamlana sp. I1 TaxID=2762061 RepID=UPI001E2DD7AB|nr:porin family protein [Tamlana sp. I1]